MAGPFIQVEWNGTLHCLVYSFVTMESVKQLQTSLSGSRLQKTVNQRAEIPLVHKYESIGEAIKRSDRYDRIQHACCRVRSNHSKSTAYKSNHTGTAVRPSMLLAACTFIYDPRRWEAPQHAWPGD